MTTMAEALLLLADRGDSGNFSRVDRNTAAVGGTLAELALAKRIDLDGRHVAVRDPSPTGNLASDEVLAQIAAGKPRKPAGWIAKLYWGFPNRVRDGLVTREVLDRKESGIFHVRRYRAVDGRAETEVRQRLDAAVQAGHTDDWTAELAGQIRALNLYRYALPELPRDTAKARIEAIARGSWTAEATKQAITNNSIAVIAALTPVYVTMFATILSNTD